MEENGTLETRGKISKKILELEAVFVAAIAFGAIFSVLFLLAGMALLAKEEKLGITFFSQSLPPDQVLLFAITEFMLAGAAIYATLVFILGYRKISDKK